MISCPNWKYPDMQILVDEFGKDNAYLAYIKNGDTPPSLENAYKLLNIENGVASSQTTLSKDTQKRLESFFTKRGVNVIDFTKEEANRYKAQWGLTKNSMVRGIADTTRGLIGILEGSSDYSFGEESGHMAFAILKGSNPKLAKEMFEKITKFAIYQKVLRDTNYINNPNYRINGKLDIDAIKEEAIGKLLREHLANETGKSNLLKDYELVLDRETPENVSYIQKWFARAIEFFKQLFNKYDDNPFKEVAKQMLGTSKNEFVGTVANLNENNKILNEVVTETLEVLKNQNKLISFVDGDFKYGDKHVRFKANDAAIGMKANKHSRELVEKGELDITDILNRYIDDNGDLRKTPLNKQGVSNLDPLENKAYNVLEAHLAERLNSLEAQAPGTKFVHSINIYNNSERPDHSGKAAKVSLIALSPEGVANVYNFEFIRQGLNIIDQDIPLNQQNASREYMKEVKGILKKGYNITKFEQVRTIPIRIGEKSSNNGKIVVYAPDSIEIAGVKTSLKDKSYVRPIPIFEEKTGNDSINKLIDNFIALYDAKKESDSKKNASSLDQIARTIRHLQIELGAPVLTYQAEMAVRMANNATSDFLENIKLIGPTDVNKEELAKIGIALDMREADLKIYEKAYLLYEDKTKSSKLTEEEKKELLDLEMASKAASRALFDLQEARRQYGAFLSLKWGTEDINIPEKEMGIADRNLTPWNKPITEAHKLAYRIISEANTDAEHRIRALTDKLHEVQKGLEQWGKGTTMFNNMLDLLKAKDKNGKRINKLIQPYKSEFYELYAEAEDKHNRKDVSGKVWIRQNIDIDAYKAWIQEEKTKAREQNEKDYPLSKRRANPDLQEEWMKRSKSNVKYWSIINDDLLINNAKRFPKKQWESEEFVELNKPQNAAVKKYYDLIQEVNKIAASSGYIQWDKSKRFLPYVYKSFNEKLMMGGNYSFANSILRSLTVSDMDLNYGQVNKITNEAFMSLPKFFTVAPKETIGPNGEKIVDHSNISEDLLANTYLFITKVIQYDEYRKIEPIVNGIMYVEKNKKALQTNHFGRIIEGSDPKSDNSKNYEALKDHIALQLYSKSYTNKADVVSRNANAGESYNKFVKGTNKFFGFKILSPVEEGGRYSLIKTIDAIKTFQVWKTLGFNISVPLYRFLSIGGQAIIQTGEYYTQKELGMAEMRHAGLQFTNQSASLHVLMMRTFLPVESQLHIEARRMSMSKFTRDTLPDFMMKLTQRAHDWIQYVNFDAMIRNAVVIDGKLHNARKWLRENSEYKNRYSKSNEERKTMEKEFDTKVEELLKEHGLVNKSKEIDGKLVVEGLDLHDPSVTKFMSMTRNMGLRLSGNITKENEVNARRNAFIRQFFMYKSWFLGMVETRFSGLSWKEGEQSYQWGRVRMVAKIASENLLTSIGRLTSMARATDKGVKHLSDLYEKKKKEYEEEKGKEFNMTREQFYDMVRNGIHMELKEMIVQLILLGGVIGLYEAVKDVDDDKKGAVAFAARLVDRAYEELNMYYNPATMAHLLNGSLLPAMALPVDFAKAIHSSVEYVTGSITGDEEMKDDANVHKHLLKMFPIASQLPNWMGIIMPEYMKELGYQPTAKQVHH